jgi:hypothetical protein
MSHAWTFKFSQQRRQKLFLLLFLFNILFSPVGCSNKTTVDNGDSPSETTPTPTPSTPSTSSSFARQLGASATVPGGDLSYYDICKAVTVDGSGNVYCAGGTQGSLGEANGGGFDAFVMKLNSSGAVQWIRQLGAVTSVPGGDTAHSDMCNGVAVDSSGNVYCAGRTNGSLGEANGGGGLNDAFVMKLDSSGAVQWIRQLGAVTSVPGGDTAHSDVCNGVAVDSSGNVYCAGSTGSSLGEAIDGGGLPDAFVMKLDSSGAVQWIRQLGTVTSVPGGDTSKGDYCYGVAVDSSGNVYCAGGTQSSLGEANGGGGVGVFDAFVMKLNSSGAVQWIRQLGAVTSVPGGDTSHDDYCNGVAVDSSGNVYCAGPTTGSLGETNGGGEDAFVMKLNSSGAVQWIRQLGTVTSVPGGDTSQYDYCNGVAVDSSGNVYCAGYTGGSLGEAEGGGGNGDVMVMKLNSSGAVQWIRQFGASTKASATGDNSNYEELYGVAVDSSGNVYAAGEADGNFADTEGGGNNGDAMVIKLPTSGNFSY